MSKRRGTVKQIARRPKHLLATARAKRLRRVPLPDVEPSPPPAIEAPAAARPAPITLTPALFTGVSARLGSGQLLAPTGRAGLLLGGSLTLDVSPYYAVGLSFERGSIDRESGGVVGMSSIEASRDRTALWADLRVRVAQIRGVGLTLGLGPGLVWESVSASGYVPSSTFGDPPIPFTCSATGGANLGLRARVGVLVPLGGGATLTADAGADMLRLGSEPLDSCIQSGGTIALFVTRLAIGYAFDVTRAVR